MAGIYIHIPFCKQACHYCNFYFSTSLKHKDSLITAILSEIEHRAPEWKNEAFDTVYFGGGTPSLLPVSDIEKLLDKLHQKFSISAHSEITLEGNPDDLDKEKLKAYKSLGISRLSIGVQSFFQDDLLKLNRSHNAKQALRVIEEAKAIGFDNITIDLIYGIPGLTDDRWQKNVQYIIDFQIPHVSAYALTVEPKTALQWQIDKELFPRVSDRQTAKQFYLLRNILLKNGFEHYEISNFAKQNYYSKHNTAYWQNTPYIGLGPAAHSFDGSQRRWNIANNIKYIKGVKTGQYFETEVLTKRDIYNETIMTGLRTVWGVDLNKIEQLGNNFSEYLQEHAKKHIHNRRLYIEKNFLKPQTDSLFIIEGIISDLFMV